MISMIKFVIEKMAPVLFAFGIPLLLTLLLTPLIRELHRKWGMVDKPDPRRINKVPIPRGGGMAIVLAVTCGYGLLFFAGDRLAEDVHTINYWKIILLSFAIALLGLADDRFSLSPRLKLFGQVVIAFLAWWWADLGVQNLWPQTPLWLDGLLTVFWITGAVNAFNLIDGLDGLASGIAFIASLGMAGSCVLVHEGHAAFFCLVFAGALLGFLRYNYHPASVFLGDSGSMYIGFVLSTLPFATHEHKSFLVSVGVPFLAMGVPIFDTSLAILRRSLRRLLVQKSEDAATGRVMTADTDHLHHRILRASGLNQRKATWILYGSTIMLVSIGLVAMMLESRATGFWMGAFTLIVVMLLKDAKIELFDAGRVLNSVARGRDHETRHRFVTLMMPFYIFFDTVVLVGVFFLCTLVLGAQHTDQSIRLAMPIRVLSIFVFLVFFKTYRTVWSRALSSNFMRLAIGCLFGSVAGSIIIYYAPSVSNRQDLIAMTLLFATISFLALMMSRIIRGIIRDIFYALDCARLKERKDVSRILVYGAGLRYKAFRRELVRTTAANDRMIVGILDDNVFLKGRYIGGIQILGTIHDAPEVINALNADAVVITCDISDDQINIVKSILAPTGVKVSHFVLLEQPV